MSAKIRSISNTKNSKEEGPDFDWLIGVWENNQTSNTYEEWHWDEDKQLEGLGYRLVQGEKVVSEHIRIFQRDDEFIYEAKLPNHDDPIAFRIVRITEGGFTCENIDYDFPKKISYELNGYDILHTQLSSSKRHLKFDFRKVQ